MQKIGAYTGSADANDEFREGSPSAGVAPTLIKGGWLNGVQRELVAVIQGAGMALSGSDDAQLLKAIHALKRAADGEFAVDIGTANNYSATYAPAVMSLDDGLELSFRAAATNTAASKFSPNGLPAKGIVGIAGAALVGGEIVSGGYCRVKYSSALGSWVLIYCSGGFGQARTAAQFDNSPRAASTAFVKGAGLQFNNISTISAPGSIPISAMGGECVLSGAGAYTVLLPTTQAQPSGAYGQILTLLNTSIAEINVKTFGSENITAGNNSVSAITLLPGDRAVLSLASSGYWHLIGGEASFKYSGTFANSLSGQWSTSPGGLIEVRGAFVSPATPGTATPVTFPFAFPNGIQEILVSVASATTSLIGAWSSNPTRTGFNGRCSEASASCYYIAKGF